MNMLFFFLSLEHLDNDFTVCISCGALFACLSVFVQVSCVANLAGIIFCLFPQICYDYRNPATMLGLWRLHVLHSFIM
jgi:hypothetical protein